MKTGLRTEQEVREKFAELVAQRDSCPEHSAARKMLSQRVRALAWVINHELVPELAFSDDAMLLYNCVE